MLLLILYLLLALVVSFLCSIMEACLLSTPYATLLVKNEQNHAWAKHFLAFKDDIDRPLSAILSLNTVAHTIGAAGVGAQAVAVFGEAYFGVISFALTLIILFFTEIIPKTIGAVYWKRLAKSVVMLIRATVFLTYPLVYLSSKVTKLLSAGAKGKSTSREEIAALTKLGAKEGVFSKGEHRILQSVLRLKEVTVANSMTPKAEVTCIKSELLVKEFSETKDDYNYSRLPVLKGESDKIAGYVVKEKIYEALAEGSKDATIASIMRNVALVPSSMPVYRVWEILLDRKEHIAVVISDAGKWVGIITLEDIIETILGFEIIDEQDHEHGITD